MVRSRNTDSVLTAHFQICSEKLQRINEIWESGNPVALLEVAHTVTSDQAHLLEACLILLLKKENLTNKQVRFFSVSVDSFHFHAGSFKSFPVEEEKKYELGLETLMRAYMCYQYGILRPVLRDHLPKRQVFQRRPDGKVVAVQEVEEDAKDGESDEEENEKGAGEEGEAENAD